MVRVIVEEEDKEERFGKEEIASVGPDACKNEDGVASSCPFSVTDGYNDVHEIKEESIVSSGAVDCENQVLQGQSNNSSSETEVVYTPHSLHSLWKQLKLERRQKGIETEFSLDNLQMIKEGMGTIKASYLHVLSDRDHLLNLVEIYSDALKKKEEEIEELCLQLSMAHSSLHKAEETITGPSVIQEYDAITL
ncbi:hypothetical protein SUGI_0251110 [Cryptomeria japonica]|nr:hypothetical protein SUGI_0251110 [Cryptomeria japonica]